MTRRRVALCSVAATAALAVSGAAAQVNRTELSLQTSVTASDNGAEAPSGEERPDLVLSVRPALRVERRGAGLRLSANASAEVLTSARDTRPDRVLPSARLDVESTLVERLLFLDARAELRQVEDDPFAARVQAGSALNARTAGTLGVTPRLRYGLDPWTSVEALSDTTITRVRRTTEGDLTTRVASVRVDRRPEPLGGSLKWRREQTDLRADAGSGLEIDELLAMLLFTPDIDWVVGLRAGSERSDLEGARERDTTAGVELRWSPGPRTELAATVDRRFFGTGWNLSAQHRTPRMSFRLGLVREPVDASTGSSGADLESALDAILRTRVPDAAQRSVMVGERIATGGLATELRGATAITANYPQLRSGGSFTWAYLSPRTTLDLTLYAERRARLVRADGPALAAGDSDTRQRGASFAWNRRLASQLSLSFGAAASRIEALDPARDDRTTEASANVGLVRNLSPRTNLSATLAHRRLKSNVAATGEFDETSVSLGLAHRF